MKDYTTEINGKEATLRCTHADMWPPLHASLGNLEALRASGEITEQKYEQIKTWERICGLQEMDEKCLSCSLCLDTSTDKPLHYRSEANVYRPPFAQAIRKLRKK